MYGCVAQTSNFAGVEQVDGDIWHIAGDLTIRGTTRELTLVTRYGGQGRHPILVL